MPSDSVTKAVLLALVCSGALLVAWAVSADDNTKRDLLRHRRLLDQSMLAAPPESSFGQVALAETPLPLLPPPAPPAQRKGVCILQASNYAIGDNSLADDSMYGWALYALRHGYRYVRVQDTVPFDAAAAAADGGWTERCYRQWRKSAAIQQVLPQCDLLVLADHDVHAVNFTASLAHLLAHWQFPEDALLLQSLDPDRPQNYLEVGGTPQLNANTGFFVFRGRPRTEKIVAQWMACPTSTKGCEEFRHRFPCDQGGWNVHVRPTLRPGELHLIPCGEANGYPQVSMAFAGDCKGHHVSHYWSGKNHVEKLFKQELPGNAREAVLARVQAEGGLQTLA